MENKKEIKEVEKGWPVQFMIKAVLVNEEGKVLVLKRADEGVWNAGKYDLPGGWLDEGESIEDTLKREFQEELGLEGATIGPVIKMSEFRNEKNECDQVKGLRMIAYYHRGEIQLNPREHSGYEWLSLDEAIEKLSTGDSFEEEKKETLKAAKKYLDMAGALDGWKRCQADFENYKKRQVESQKDLLRYSTQNIVLQILPVIDNFQSSTAHIPEDQKDNPWVTGIMYIQKQLEQVLSDNGVMECEVRIGDNFDPAKHEAVEDKECACEKGEEKEFKNKIKQVVVRGYMIGDKVIRPARVIVE
ncbi:MAG: GrpE protein [uncultured bacterium]|nr:MAG: GrpE protein [uncultured bacterium]